MVEHVPCDAAHQVTRWPRRCFRRTLLVEEGMDDGRPLFRPRLCAAATGPRPSGRSSARLGACDRRCRHGRVPLHAGLSGASPAQPKPRRRRRANSLRAGRLGAPPPRLTRVRRPRGPRRSERRSRSWRRRGCDRPTAACRPGTQCRPARRSGRCSPSGWSSAASSPLPRRHHPGQSSAEANTHVFPTSRPTRIARRLTSWSK